MAMHPMIRQQKVGRLVPKGTSLHYPENAKVMPDLPPEARAAHDWIHENIKDADILGYKNRTPRRWSIAGPQKFVHYTRDEGHFRLNNLCTLPHLHMKPELRRLECWWLPKLPKVVHPVVYHPPVPRIRRVHTIWSRPQMWADEEHYERWNVSAQYDSYSDVEAKIWESKHYDKGNSNKFYKANKDSIDKLRKDYKKYFYKERPKVFVRQQLNSGLKPRRWDLEELKKLDDWEYYFTKIVPTLDTSEYVGTSNEPSEGSIIYDHGMNDPNDDWWGT
ncbi:unnamed protein product [Calypogeia fissa]